jgi:hypothetical protein
MHGGEEIWECVCASIRSSGFFFFWLRDRCKLKKRKARVGHPGLSRGVVKLTGRPARNAAPLPSPSHTALTLALDHAFWSYSKRQGARTTSRCGSRRLGIVIIYPYRAHTAEEPVGDGPRGRC